MNIERLTIQNFKGFTERTFEFPDHFHVLIGDNGTGKSAVLDALAVGVGSFMLGIDGVESRFVRPDEVRHERYLSDSSLNLEPQYPVTITCLGVVDRRRMTWTRSVNQIGGRTTRQKASPIAEVARELQSAVRSGNDVVLPVIAYYGTGRLWVQKKEKAVEPVEPGSRTRGYMDCLDPASDQRQWMRWIKTAELIALQQRRRVLALESVKAAVADCMEGWKGIDWDVRMDELVATSSDHRCLPFRMLSDGVRNMLGMVMDIAYRAATLNPHLNEHVLLETPGVVLIDEIDLHLHPTWQRRVVRDLRRAFPKLQFIATTHSPFIVQSLEPGQLINLDCPPGQPAASDYADSSIEDIAEEEMNVEMPQKSRHYLEMMKVAKEYYQLLEQAPQTPAERLDQLKRELDELLIPFSDEPAYNAFLEMKREAAGLGSGRPDEAG